MPTYDYECDACGHRFELFQSIKAAPIRKCPDCGKLKVRRLIGIGAGVIFKGSGFYCTDYRDKAYQASADKDKPQSAADKSGSGADKSGSSADKSAGEKTAAGPDKNGSAANKNGPGADKSATSTDKTASSKPAREAKKSK